MKKFSNALSCAIFLIIFLSVLIACVPSRSQYIVTPPEQEQPETPIIESTSTGRPVYTPGTLVDYTVQSGDNLAYLAWRFGCAKHEILFHNPEIPKDITTLPQGYAMKMPIYYKPFWGSSYQILPDALFVNGPASIGFDVETFLSSTPGWFKNYSAKLDGQTKTASQIINYFAQRFSISPRVLLVLIEFQTGALSQPEKPLNVEAGLLGFRHVQSNFMAQLSHAANALNAAFYDYSNMKLEQFVGRDGLVENIDPWQNAATVAFHVYFSKLLEGDAYQKAIGPDGLARTYMGMFGNPWQNEEGQIPGSLRQPEMILPFMEPGVWSFAGVEESIWASGKTWSSILFTPTGDSQICSRTNSATIAVADGIVARSEFGTVVLDLDGDGDERTGWVVVYTALANDGRATQDEVLLQGNQLGRANCVADKISNLGLQVARKYNGQWMPATLDALPFTLSGWTPLDGELLPNNQP